MKLVERVLDNISTDEVTSLAAAFNLPQTKMTSVINSMIPGILSAFKARIVSSMNSGNIEPLTNLLNNIHTNLSIDELFDDNIQALNTVYQRISQFTGIPIHDIAHIVPSLMPTISNAISKMLQEFGSASLMISGNNFINDLVTNENGYDKAINAANKFIGSVFGLDMEQDSQIKSHATSVEDGFLQNLFDLFDQDNDGSVMDDVYHMLVR